MHRPFDKFLLGEGKGNIRPFHRLFLFLAGRRHRIDAMETGNEGFPEEVEAVLIGIGILKEHRLLQEIDEFLESHLEMNQGFDWRMGLQIRHMDGKDFDKLEMLLDDFR